MRVFFCMVPALIVFSIVFVVGVELIGANPQQALYVAACVGAGMFFLGWQVTDPKRERQRDQAAQSAAAHKGEQHGA